MNDLELCRKKARELLVGPLVVAADTVSAVVDMLQLHATIADEERGGDEYPCGVPMVFLETSPALPRRVTDFALSELTPLSTALELLAERAALVVGYHANGIIISPMYADAPTEAPAMANPVFHGPPTSEPAPIAPSRPPVCQSVKFYGGPADGLMETVQYAPDDAYIVPTNFQGVLYFPPDQQQVSVFAGWLNPSPPAENG